MVLKSTSTDWRPEYNGLVSEIKLRHYSPLIKSKAVFIANWDFSFQFASMLRLVLKMRLGKEATLDQSLKQFMLNILLC
jgi:hypothetical protein